MSTENSGKNSGGANNLIPHRFQPGTSGNPGGRPKKQPITDYLRSQLESDVPSGMLGSMHPEFRSNLLALYGNNPTFGQMLALRLISQAAEGEIAALSLLLDRVEGKVNQKTSVEGSSDLVLRVIRADL